MNRTQGLLIITIIMAALTALAFRVEGDRERPLTYTGITGLFLVCTIVSYLRARAQTDADTAKPSRKKYKRSRDGNYILPPTRLENWRADYIQGPPECSGWALTGLAFDAPEDP